MATVQKDFTSTTTSDEVLITRGRVSIAGTFVASVQLQRYGNGAFNPVKTYTAVIEETIGDGTPARYRFECTAYTSGTAKAELIGTRART